MIKNSAIKHIHVPQYNSMSLEKIFKLMVEGKPELLKYFPDQRDIHKLPR
jgi:hypothetical protein